jgi:hypothetical protein
MLKTSNNPLAHLLPNDEQEEDSTPKIQVVKLQLNPIKVEKIRSKMEMEDSNKFQPVTHNFGPTVRNHISS